MARKRGLPSSVSEAEWRELDKLAKRANQRLASALPEQRRALSTYAPDKFSRAMPQSRPEYIKRMSELERFLQSKQTTRSGWKEIKRKSVENAGKTLRDKRHYDLTDEELANIFIETHAKSRKNFYKILDLVQAEKYDSEKSDIAFTDEKLQAAINKAVRSHMSAGDAIKRKERARNRAIKAEDLRK